MVLNVEGSAALACDSASAPTLAGSAFFAGAAGATAGADAFSRWISFFISLFSLSRRRTVSASVSAPCAGGVPGRDSKAASRSVGRVWAGRIIRGGKRGLGEEVLREVDGFSWT